MLERFHVAPGHPRALLGQVAEPDPVGSQERDLGAGEERRGEEAQEDDAEGGPEAHGSPPFRASESGLGVPSDAAGPGAGGAGSRTSTWRMRVRCIVSTTTRTPSASTLSPR